MSRSPGGRSNIDYPIALLLLSCLQRRRESGEAANTIMDQLLSLVNSQVYMATTYTNRKSLRILLFFGLNRFFSIDSQAWNPDAIQDDNTAATSRVCRRSTFGFPN
jgi:hypothetical protein